MKDDHILGSHTRSEEEIMNGSKEFPKFLGLLEETRSTSLDKNRTFWHGHWLSVKTYQEKITRQTG